MQAWRTARAPLQAFFPFLRGESNARDQVDDAEAARFSDDTLHNRSTRTDPGDPLEPRGFSGLHAAFVPVWRPSPVARRAFPED
jgi:hypothetical protein